MSGKAIIFTVLALGGIGAAYVAVRKYYLQQIDKLKNEMQYGVVGFRFGKASMELLEIFLTIRLTNKSNISAEIINFSADVMVNNVYVATVKLDTDRLVGKIRTNKPVEGSKKNILPAKGYSDIDVAIDIVPKQLKDNALSIIKSYVGTKDLSIQVQNGKALVKVGPLTKEIEFDYATSLKELTAP